MLRLLELTVAQPPPMLYETAVPVVPGEVCNVNVVEVGTAVTKVNVVVIPVPATLIPLPIRAEVNEAPVSVRVVVEVDVLAVLD